MTRPEAPDSHLHNDLPAFDAPPLVEVSISVQFTEVEGLNTAHLGLVWDKFRNEFPLVETQPPLPRILEPDRLTPGSVTVELKQTPPAPRMWFLNGSGTRLVQIQRDRFAFNWRKTDADEKYPRYNQVRSDFSQNLEVFTQFLEEEGFEGLQPNQVDLTYVNLIPGGDKQHGYSPLENHLRLWAGVPSGSCLPKPESTSLKTQFAFRDGDEFLGRLHVHLEPRFLTIDESPVYELQLTAGEHPLTRECTVSRRFWIAPMSGSCKHSQASPPRRCTRNGTGDSKLATCSQVG